MKKIVSLLLVLMLTMGLIAGCTSKEDENKLPDNNIQDENIQDESNTSNDSKFEEKDGFLVYTDTENGPFEESGLKISIKKGEGGYAEFIKTDLNGNETVDYYKFDYVDNIAEKYYYVSAMGTAYYYYYDLEKDELAKVEDGDHNDTTESLKSAGRWDGAAEKTKEEVKILEDYFKEQYDTTIKEAVLE